MASVQELLDQQAQLLPEQSEHLIRQLVDHNRQLAKKQKGSTRKRALTGAEVSERQQKAMTRAQTRAKAVLKGKARAGKEMPRRQTRSQKVAELLRDQQM
ncbi:MAG: hypothetical protein M1840_001811 [Geoglossum simile]|nr:MAG: hypothetical protein M1840_001811 [Geoglossum simile]